jgi:hypothetical protein
MGSLAEWRNEMDEGRMAKLGYPAIVAVVLGVGVLAAILAWLTRRLVHIDVLRRHHEVGSTVFLQMGVMFAVLLAFVFSEVWGEYNTAAGAVDQECGALNSVSVLSRALPAEARGRINTLLGAYTRDVIAKEFPLMAMRHSSQDAEAGFQALWLAATAVSDGSNVRDGILSQLTSAYASRNMRLFQMGRGLPGLIWLLLLSFVVALVGFVLFFGVEYILSQMLFIGVFAALLAFILVIVMLMDFPFEGVLRLPPDCFVQAAEKLAALSGSPTSPLAQE